MTVTLRDVAAACGVTTSTVSRALSNDGRLSAATRARVRLAAQQLGYRPNLAARHLVTGRTKTLWFLCSGLEAQQNHRPANAAARRLLNAGYDLLVAVHQNHAAVHERLMARLRQHLCDGALVIADQLDRSSPLLAALHGDGFPLVFVDRHRDDLAAPAVSSANMEAAHQLVRRCADEGITAVLNLFNEENPVERARSAGLRSACADLGLTMVTPDATLSSAPWAICASSEVSVRTWLRAHPQRPQRPQQPHCIAIFDEWAGDLIPEAIVWCAHQDFSAMGTLAAELLIDRVEDRDPAPGLRTVPVLRYERLSDQRPPESQAF